MEDIKSILNPDKRYARIVTEIRKKFDELSYYERSRVFDDFLTCAICTFHNTNLRYRLLACDIENEKKYLEVIKHYKPKEQLIIKEILHLFIAAVEAKNYSDPLGEYYEEYFANSRLGQFFTPMEVCRIMAEMVINEESEYKTVVDDTGCGSGRNLLAAAEVNPKNFFKARDISITVAKLCTLNCFMNGLRGEVAWGDAITLETWKVWEVNMMGFGIREIPIEESFYFGQEKQALESFRRRKEKEKEKLNEKIQKQSNKTDLQFKLF